MLASSSIDVPVGQLGAQVNLVPGDGQHPSADVEQPVDGVDGLAFAAEDAGQGQHQQVAQLAAAQADRRRSES